jgi:deoxyadenosine/deoxycytidine kinase
VEIQFTGIRPGEKLFEELATDEEHADKTKHPKIFVGRFRPYDWDELLVKMDELKACTDGADDATVRQRFTSLVPEYKPMVLPGQGTYIAVAGQHGRSGKSSLVKWLCQQFELTPFFEPHDENPYLADFYADMPRWAFNSQLFFLVKRFKIHRELEASGRGVVQDRTLDEDAEVFAAVPPPAGHINDRDWATYSDLYTSLRSELRPPDLMIYLRCEVKTLRKRIQMRGRPTSRRSPRRTCAPCTGSTSSGSPATTARPRWCSRPTAWTT